jgi:hypothetical protein
MVWAMSYSCIIFCNKHKNVVKTIPIRVQAAVVGANMTPFESF